MPTTTRIDDMEAAAHGRRRRRLRALVSTKFLRAGICGAQASIELLNFSRWSTDCAKARTASGEPLCYLTDDDPHNDAEPWQEIERIALERWRSSTYATMPANTNVDVIVVPSALAHCRSRTGKRWYRIWQDAMVDGREDVHRAYWAAVRAEYADVLRPGARRASPLLLIHYDGTWQVVVPLPRPGSPTEYLSDAVPCP